MITLDQAVAELTEIAEAKRDETGEDYVYCNPTGSADCYYVHYADEIGTAPEPGCIVGKWLHDKHGVTLAALSDHEYSAASEVMNHLGIDAGWDVRNFVERVQTKQDSGRYGWLTAVTDAVRQNIVGH